MLHTALLLSSHIKPHGNIGADTKKPHFRRPNKISEMLRLYALFIRYEWKALKSSADCGSLGGSNRWLNILHSSHRVSSVK